MERITPGRAEATQTDANVREDRTTGPVFQGNNENFHYGYMDLDGPGLPLPREAQSSGKGVLPQRLSRDPLCIADRTSQPASQSAL